MTTNSLLNSHTTLLHPPIFTVFSKSRKWAAKWVRLFRTAVAFAPRLITSSIHSLSQTRIGPLSFTNQEENHNPNSSASRNSEVSFNTHYHNNAMILMMALSQLKLFARFKISLRSGIPLILNLIPMNKHMINLSKEATSSLLWSPLLSTTQAQPFPSMDRPKPLDFHSRNLASPHAALMNWTCAISSSLPRIKIL